MHIACYLLTEGKFKPALLTEELLIELSKNLRANGTEIVGFPDGEIECEGIYIPGKNTKYGVMAIPNLEGDEDN